jgi:hypothetical protein
MRNISKIAFIVLCVFTLASVASFAFAGTAQSASVWTTDDAGNHENQFDIGETITINWNADPEGSTVDITIYNEAGNPIGYSWSGLTNDKSGTISFTASAKGVYYIDVTGVSVRFPVAVGTVLVVPESAFGALAAVGAGLAAFGSVAIIKRKCA